MRRVKLYTLKVEDVIVSGDFVEVSSFNRDEVIKIRNSDEFVLPSAKVQYTKLPIEKYYNHCGNLGVKEYSYDTEDELNNQLKIKSILTKGVKWTIPLTVIFALLSVLLPTERTVYLMTAAYATQTIAQNDRVQKIGSDVLEVVEKKLSEMKGESSNDNSK